MLPDPCAVIFIAAALEINFQHFRRSQLMVSASFADNSGVCLTTRFSKRLVKDATEGVTETQSKGSGSMMEVEGRREG